MTDEIEGKEPSWQDALVRGKRDRPPRVVLYGGHGIGKSTLASKFPSPIFVPTEDGLGALDVVSFPKAETYDEVQANMMRLIRDDHPFRTCVLDSADWLMEPLIRQEVEKSNTTKELSYGKDRMLMAEEFRNILDGFNVMRDRRGMNVVVICHADVSRFEDPQTEPYDRYKPKLQDRSNALLQEWADVIGFCAFKVVIKKAEVGFNREVARGVTTGDRLIHLVEKPAFVAKSRYPDTPEVIDMDITQIRKHVPIKD